MHDAALSLLLRENLLQHQSDGCFRACAEASWKDGALGDIFEETRFAVVLCTDDDNSRQLE